MKYKCFHEKPRQNILILVEKMEEIIAKILKGVENVHFLVIFLYFPNS